MQWAYAQTRFLMNPKKSQRLYNPFKIINRQEYRSNFSKRFLDLYSLLYIELQAFTLPVQD